MDCPVCKQTLKRADRQGIEIDYCPKCRGIWLDRGELDKLVELAAESAALRLDASRKPKQRDEHQTYPSEHRDSTRYKKRESGLSKILDFD